MDNETATGQDIIRLYLADQCRWTLYTDAQLFDAMRYCARMDLNKPIRMVAKVLDARGVLPERDKFLAR